MMKKGDEPVVIKKIHLTWVAFIFFVLGFISVSYRIIVAVEPYRYNISCGDTAFDNVRYREYVNNSKITVWEEDGTEHTILQGICTATKVSGGWSLEAGQTLAYLLYWLICLGCTLAHGDDLLIYYRHDNTESI